MKPTEFTASSPGSPPSEISVQPCTDARCAIHARGADPGEAARSTCARQILRAYDRADAIALLEQEIPHTPGLNLQRILLRFQSSPLCAGESERIPCTSEDPEIESFRADQILLVNGNTSWRVDDILMGGKSQIAPHTRLPAQIFSMGKARMQTIHAFDRICAPLDIEIVVTRIQGTDPVPLAGAILGTVTKKSYDIAIQSDGRVTKTDMIVDLEAKAHAELALHRLLIEDGGGDWVVDDIRIDGSSVLGEAKELPGEMFGPDIVDGFVKYGTVAPGTPIHLRIQYIGDDPEGKPLALVLDRPGATRSGSIASESEVAQFRGT